MEIDREFVQFYHRRIAWLALGDFDRAAADADHSLQLMDFASLHAPTSGMGPKCTNSTARFVLFQPHASGRSPRHSSRSIPTKRSPKSKDGLHQIADAYRLQGADEEDLAEDEFMLRLEDMKESLEEQYEIEPAAQQTNWPKRLPREQYELAAELRDRIARHKQPRS